MVKLFASVRRSLQAALFPAALAAACVLVNAGSASATSTPVTVGTASNYGLLIGSGDTLTMGGGLNLAGNLGIGKGSTANLSGNNAIAGSAYEDSNVTVNYSGNTSISGGYYTTSMSQALTDATTAATNATALAATPGLVDQNSLININGGSVTIKALSNLSENVLNISSLSLINGTITFDDNGYTGAKFIINVTGNFSINSTGTSKSVITGINGASAADILFNVEGTGSTVSITGNSTNQTIGTILAPKRNVTVGGGGSLTGSIIAGVNNAGTNYTVQSQNTGFNLTDYAYVARAKVPEPSSIALFGGGLAAIAWIGRRRRKA